MKSKTKLKIIKWVSKLLKFQETSYYQYIIQKHYTDIEFFQFCAHFTQNELNDLYKYDLLDDIILKAFIKKLKESKILKIEVQKHPYDKNLQMVKSTLRILKV